MAGRTSTRAGAGAISPPKRYVYFWVDGIHVQARLEDDPKCLEVNLLAHAPERLHEEFKRRIKTQTILPSADTAAMLFWACLLWPNQHAQSRWLADACHQAHRSAN
jgi:hypothetical protein